MPASSDLFIVMATLGIMIFGIVMVLSASMGQALTHQSYLLITAFKEVLFAVVGYFGMTFAAHNFRLKWLSENSFRKLILVVGGLLLVCLVFPAVNGAHGWIRIPGVNITIQPAEFAKTMSFLIVASFLGDRNFRRDAKCWDLIKRPFMFIGAYCFIILFLQHDFGSMLVVLLIACVCILIPRQKALSGFQKGMRILFWAVVILALFLFATKPGGAILTAALDSTHMAAYQKNRFLSAIDPFADQYNSSYQLINGLISFASGGLFGRGIGGSVRKYMSFPAANTDYILAVTVEETGYFGFLFLMTLYFIIIFRLLSYAQKIRSEKARIVLTGTAMYFVIHIFFNVGGVTGMIPLTGIPLLMMSAGGSSTLNAMIAIGISQAVIGEYRNGRIQ